MVLTILPTSFAIIIKLMVFVVFLMFFGHCGVLNVFCEILPWLYLHDFGIVHIVLFVWRQVKTTKCKTCIECCLFLMDINNIIKV